MSDKIAILSFASIKLFKDKTKTFTGDFHINNKLNFKIKKYDNFDTNIIINKDTIDKANLINSDKVEIEFTVGKIIDNRFKNVKKIKLYGYVERMTIVYNDVYSIEGKFLKGKDIEKEYIRRCKI